MLAWHSLQAGVPISRVRVRRPKFKEQGCRSAKRSSRTRLRLAGCPPTSARLSIVLVGPGRAGRAFARSWTAAGGLDRRVVARDPAARPSVRAGAPARGGARRSDDRSGSRCDVLDPRGPRRRDRAARASALAARLACRFALSPLGRAAERGARAARRPAERRVGSLHPLRAFTRRSRRDDWSDAFVAVEGDAAAATIGARICPRRRVRARTGSRPRASPSTTRRRRSPPAARSLAPLVRGARLGASRAPGGGRRGRRSRTSRPRAVEAVGRLAVRRRVHRSGRAARRRDGPAHRDALAGSPEPSGALRPARGGDARGARPAGGGRGDRRILARAGERSETPSARVTSVGRLRPKG